MRTPLPTLMIWHGGYLASIEMAKHIPMHKPPPDEREGTFKTSLSHGRINHHPEVKEPHRGVVGCRRRTPWKGGD